MKLIPQTLCATVAVAVLALSGCASMSSSPSATAKLESTRGNSAKGTIRFVQTGENKVRVSGEVSGLKPSSEHGFHIHEKGDCSSGDGNSAGGHFNPTGSQHGRYGSGPHHGGDLPSLRSDANGVATISVDLTGITLQSGAPNNIVGRGLIVHADPDDFVTQPTGNAGARLACAVIR